MSELADYGFSGAKVSNSTLAVEFERPQFYVAEKLRQQQKLSSLKVDGVSTSEHDAMLAHAVSFYQDIFTIKVTNNDHLSEILSCTDSYVPEELSSQELISCAKSASASKSLGNDGLPYECYAQFWDVSYDRLS